METSSGNMLSRAAPTMQTPATTRMQRWDGRRLRQSWFSCLLRPRALARFPLLGARELT